MSASLREAGDGWTREGLPLLRVGWIRDASDWPRGARASHGLSERAAFFVCALSGRPPGGPWDMGLGGEAPAPSSPGERVPVVEWQGCAREWLASCGIMWTVRKGHRLSHWAIGCERCANPPFSAKSIHCRLGFRLLVPVAQALVS